MALNALLEKQLGHWPKFKKFHIHSLTTTGWGGGGANLTLFSLYGQSLQNSHENFGHETWPLAKRSGSCTYTLFLPQGVQIELIIHLRAVVSEVHVRANFHTCHIWAWNLTIGQSSRSCTYTLFLPHRVEIEFIFPLRAAVSGIRADFQNCHISVWNLAIGQSFRSCTYNLFLPQRAEIQLIFALRATVCEIRADFQNCHILV